MNKQFSDWYDSLPDGEPTYQMAFEAGAEQERARLAAGVELEAAGYAFKDYLEIMEERGVLDLYENHTFMEDEWANIPFVTLQSAQDAVAAERVKYQAALAQALGAMQNAHIVGGMKSIEAAIATIEGLAS